MDGVFAEQREFIPVKSPVSKIRHQKVHASVPVYIPATTAAGVGVGAAQAAGAFAKDIATPLSGEEKAERSRRAAAAARGGRTATVLTGGSLSQKSQGSAASGGGTALLGG